ncbi:MAG: hypothetical protein HQK54_14030 [Oligoflexales bacterium]|nr:hypothetical protein [Oligoflexales bacterium]
MKVFAIATVSVGMALFLGACGKKKDDDKNSEGAGKTVLFESVRETSPKIQPSASLALNWGSGGTTYEIFNLIRDYNDNTDNGKVDGSNMYKALYDASMYMASAYQSCTPFGEKAVTSPFNFGTEEVSQKYDCGIDGTQSNPMGNYTTSFVVKREAGFDYAVGANETADQYSKRFSATQKKFLMGWAVVSPGNSTTRAIYQGKLDSTTNDVVLNSSYLVDYTGGPMAGSNYSVRLNLVGNMTTHLFKMRLAKSQISIAAHGYAKGEGKFYLFRYESIGQGENGKAQYFCLASETTEAQMRAVDENGSATVPANCADLASGLPAKNYTTDDEASKAADFKGKGDLGIGLDY